MLFGTLCVASLAVGVESVSVTAHESHIAPIAEDLTVRTYRGVPVRGEFSAVSTAGEALTFRLAALPKKGTVSIDGASFIYTPADGKRGKDSFTYTAADECGNVSGEATVSITIEKQNTDVSYPDISPEDNPCAAVMLAEYGIYTGNRIGSCYHFGSDEALTRGEFLAMCMELADAQPLTGITRTGFYDDTDMPSWVKPYVSAALMYGLITGYPNESGSPVFSANDGISSFEAAVMLNNVLGITDVVSVSAFEKADYAPEWAVQAVANLSSCDIISGLSAKPLTRGEAADMLCAAIELIEERGRDSSLLSWAK